MRLSAERVRGEALAAGFDLVGLARAEPLPGDFLLGWLDAGHHADMAWMARRLEPRLDVTRLLPGARTVVALACNYWHGDEPGVVARYARGRDYHATMRDRLRGLRRALRGAYPGLGDHGSVDTGPVAEKVWAVKAGLGTVGKNGCLITPRFGSWVVLAVVVLDAEVDRYDAPGEDDVCGRCRLCIDACPTEAILPGKVIDARACLSYQTIENEGPAPEAVRPSMAATVFGCDICQDVCPHNLSPVTGSARFVPREVGSLTALALASLSPEEWERLSPGTPLVRAGYDGVRKNAAYALGASRSPAARPVLEGLLGDASPVVAEAARWALARL